ncbi:MAG: hypothetical protein LAT77_08105, partial [Aliidiomarina sp.]|uniref:hypothetical protein n=1 Tax=Aliidiomarina sp. TaxID=1872439 RepID=UPI0025C0CA72
TEVALVDAVLMQVPTQIAWLDILLKNVLLRSLPKQGSEFYATYRRSQELVNDFFKSFLCVASSP